MTGAKVRIPLAVAAVWMLSACATVEPVDCALFPQFGPEAVVEGQAVNERLELLALGRSFPSPDRVAMAAAYASLEDYGAAFEMASLSGGSGSREEAHLAIVNAAAANGSLETALRAAEPIDYSRNVARSNLAIAVAQGKAGQEQAAEESFEAAREANRNMVRQYAYYSLLSWELAQSGDFNRAIEQAQKIEDSYWGYRAHAMVRIAWEQHKAGFDSAALMTLQSVRSEFERADGPSPRWWTIRDMQFLLAELFFQLGDHQSSMSLLTDASEYFAEELYNAGDFDRVSASLLWDDLAEATGQSGPASRAEEFRQQAIQNLIIDDRTIGVPSAYHAFSKSEIVRWLLANGRSDWVYETFRDHDDHFAQRSLGEAIAQAEASLGNTDRAIAAAQAIDNKRSRCVALLLSFAEVSAQDRSENAARITDAVNTENCYWVVGGMPEGLHYDLAISAAEVGDRESACEAVRAIGSQGVWFGTVARIAIARAEKGDFTGAQAMVRWAHGSGNIDGTEASEILAVIAATNPSAPDADDIIPPVLGNTEAFAYLQRATRRYSVWYEDGIWDQ